MRMQSLYTGTDNLVYCDTKRLILRKWVYTKNASRALSRRVLVGSAQDLTIEYTSASCKTADEMALTGSTLGD